MKPAGTPPGRAGAKPSTRLWQLAILWSFAAATALIIVVGMATGSVAAGSLVSYLVVMAVFGALTVVFMLPNVAMILGLVTFGLGYFVMVIVMNATFYGLVLAPMMITGTVLGAGLSGVLLAGLVLVPQALVLVDRARLEGWAGRQPGLTWRRRDSGPIGQLTIVCSANALYHGRRDGGPVWDSTGQVRRHLLESGQVKAIRILSPREIGKSAGSVYIWTNGKEAFGAADPAASDYTLWLDRPGHTERPLPPGKMFTFSNINQLEISEGGADQPGKVLGQALSLQAVPRVTCPPLVLPVASGITSGGNKGGLTLQHGAPMQLLGYTSADVWGAFGLNVPDTVWSGRPAGGQTSQQAAMTGFEQRRVSQAGLAAPLLDADPLSDKSEDEDRAISTYLHSLGTSKALEDKTEKRLIRLLDAVHAQPTAAYAPRLYSGLLLAGKRHPAIGARFLPQMLNLVEGKPHGIPPKQEKTARHCLSLLALDDASRAAAAPRVQSVLEQAHAADPAKVDGDLIAAGAVFGLDVLPFAMAVDMPLGKWKWMLWAVPYAARAPLYPELLRRVQTRVEQGSGRVVKDVIDALRLLYAHGFETEVRQLIAKLPEADAQKWSASITGPLPDAVRADAGRMAKIGF
ncbi:hypothetical protein [Tropicibacter oceani]|uniref:Uncharacterized protein n=1 Tax=Tropicibacter oceani TaxID=3058420 RepID=A0ABY8QE85_9RHOB|nr:hypothetical protein [Tropicibacter oceani]WGW02318.1 hypothetical protein QF118_10165 [Tropicibacter oceani]